MAAMPPHIFSVVPPFATPAPEALAVPPTPPEPAGAAALDSDVGAGTDGAGCSACGVDGAHALTTETSVRAKPSSWCFTLDVLHGRPRCVESPRCLVAEVMSRGIV